MELRFNTPQDWEAFHDCWETTNGDIDPPDQFDYHEVDAESGLGAEILVELCDYTDEELEAITRMYTIMFYYFENYT